MQHRKELRQKGHEKIQKETYHKRGKNIIFGKRWGINIAFGSKYRPAYMNVRCPVISPEITGLK
jgi:hypothetical protein